jgi:carboxypeptidase T
MSQTGRNRIARARAARDHARVALLLLAGVAALTVVSRSPDEAPLRSTGVTQADPAVRSAVRVQPSDDAQLAIVHAVALDQWSEHVAVAQPVLDIVVDGAGLVRLSEHGVAWQLLVADVDALAAAERQRLEQPQAQRPSDWFAEYHDFEAISARLEWLAAEHPELVSLSVIGSSIEGRPLLALQIGGRDEAALPMLINGGQHAREWIAATVPICITERLLGGYASDASLRAFVDGTRLWVVPVVNPDGYQYSWNADRYWRKNRRGDHGVDLNRNFSVAFGGEGSSANKRSQTYRGPHAFSEPETQALRHLVRRESIAVHIDYHAYGQLLLHPWAHTKTPPSERDRYAAIGDRMASAIFAEHGQRYEIQAGADLYPAAGTMSDWMHGEADALSFTVELRPNGGSGFVLPPEQIRPTCDEAFAAMLELRKSAR